MKKIIKNVFIVNEREISISDVLIVNERIEKIASTIHLHNEKVTIINGEGLYLLPGMIDDQVHFREPGFTNKGTIYSESKAAVAGGITSYMDMPNTHPNVLDLESLEYKYQLASSNSLANYSFFMGVNKNNIEEVLKVNNEIICGISDDGLYMDKDESILANHLDFLEQLFLRSNSLIALHCEDDKLIKKNEILFTQKFGNDIPASFHPQIRSEDVCFNATQKVVHLARKTNARFHALHISTAKEISLFQSNSLIENKRITAEACVHHLWFNEKDYMHLGHLIKWNPAIKSEHDRKGLIQGLKDNYLDIIATDHAPHLLEEKNGHYFHSKSGGPLVQHALPMLLELYHRGELTLQEIVSKTSNNVALLYKIKERGFIREGYYADLVLVDLNNTWKVNNENIVYKCKWSPLENVSFKSKIISTFVNGQNVYSNGIFNDSFKGKRIMFEKER